MERWNIGKNQTINVIPQLWVQVMQMSPHTPLWQRGARGDFISRILKSPFIPLCQRGIKTPETEGLPINFFSIFPTHYYITPVFQYSKVFLQWKLCAIQISA